MLTVTEKNPLVPKQRAELDVLFLYRTGKKRRYFTALSEQALSTLRCTVQSYHSLPKVSSVKLTKQELDDIVFKAEQELYNAKDETWQKVKQLSRGLLVAQINKLYSRLFHFLNEKQPKLLAIWNGHKWQDNVLHAVNKHFNIPITYFENGVLPKTTTMDFSGINALNSVPRDIAFYQNLPQSDAKLTHKIVGRKYKNKKQIKTKFKLPKKYLLVPFQKDRDSQILDNSKWIKSMRQMFAVLLEALEASGRDDLHIVFREHPSAKTKYSDLYKQAAKHPRLCFDQQSDLTEIITNAKAVVTINSTVGLESLLLDTKVITLGEAFYNVSSLVLSASSPSDLVTQINALSRFSLDRKLLQQFVGYLESDYVIAGDWKKPDKQHFDSIRQRFFNYLTALPNSYKATA
jgi:capsular polysaccharide export protein